MKRYGKKNAEAVAAEMVRMIFDGRLRTGQRIDRNELASDLGLSRAPVQEALVQLERDGIIRTRYHRGAFVERFDAETVREQFLIFGMLSGEAAARAAADPDPELLGELRALVARMRVTGDPEECDALGFEFRRQVNRRVAGPRLRALFRSFQAFMPEAFRLLWPAHAKIILPYYETELAAMECGDPDLARRNELEKAAIMAEEVIGELIARGTLAPRPDPGGRGDGAGPTVRGARQRGWSGAADIRGVLQPVPVRPPHP